MTINYFFSDVCTVLEACDCPQTPSARWNNSIDMYYRSVDGLEHITRDFILWDTERYVTEIQARKKHCITERRVAFIYEVEKIGKFAIIACFKQSLTGRIEAIDFQCVIPAKREESKIKAWHRDLSKYAPFTRSTLAFQVPEEDTGVSFVDKVFSGLTHNPVRLSVDKAQERQRERCVLFLSTWFSDLRIRNKDIYDSLYSVIQILAQYELLMAGRKFFKLDHTWHTQDQVLQHQLFAIPLGDLTIIIENLPFTTILQMLNYRHAPVELRTKLNEIKIVKQQEVERWSVEQSAHIPPQSWSNWCREKGATAMYFVWQHSIPVTWMRISDRLLRPFCTLASYLTALIPSPVKAGATYVDSYLPRGWLNKVFSGAGLTSGAYLAWYLGLFANLFGLGFFLLTQGMHKAVDHQWVDLPHARLRGVKDYIPGSKIPTIAMYLNLTTWLIVGVFSWQYRQSLVGSMVSKIAVTEFFSQIFDRYIQKGNITEEDSTRSKYLFMMLGETIIEAGLFSVAMGGAVMGEFNRLVAEHHVAINCEASTFSFDIFENMANTIQLICGQEGAEGYCAIDAYGLIKCNVTADNL